MTTTEQREEWKALCEKATKSGWIRSGVRRKLGDESCIVVETEDGTETIAFFPIGSQQHDKYFGEAFADAAFVAASRTALSSLISHVDALEAENERLREALKPFADAGGYLARETTGFLDEDRLELAGEYDMPVNFGDLFSHGDFRRARAAMGESE